MYKLYFSLLSKKFSILIISACVAKDTTNSIFHSVNP